jgi:hypothetical protein
MIIELGERGRVKDLLKRDLNRYNKFRTKPQL